ncbi:MAG TPA: hypothetical protein VGA01_19095 [Candidatus Binatia bacterium]
MPDRWCTVTVTNGAGRRHSLDVLASSTYDAAHLYVAQVKGEPRACSSFPIPTVATVFEVVTNDKLYRVTGTALQAWIQKRREGWKGPKGMLFNRRPTLE